jgi:hypothetical protein
LQEVLRVDVTSGKPFTLTSTIGLARLYKARHGAIMRTNQLEGKIAAMGNWQPPTQSFMPMKRLTPEKLKER